MKNLGIEIYNYFTNSLYSLWRMSPLICYPKTPTRYTTYLFLELRSHLSNVYVCGANDFKHKYTLHV